MVVLVASQKTLLPHWICSSPRSIDFVK